MPQVRRSNFRDIIQIYNESGNNAAMEYIHQRFDVKYPRDVIRRIKNTPGFRYDETEKKFIIDNEIRKESVFMGIDELCNHANPVLSLELEKKSYINERRLTIELLYQELMQEKLMELSKYISLNRYQSTVVIDKTALLADGFQLKFH